MGYLLLVDECMCCALNRFKNTYFKPKTLFFFFLLFFFFFMVLFWVFLFFCFFMKVNEEEMST